MIDPVALPTASPPTGLSGSGAIAAAESGIPADPTAFANMLGTGGATSAAEAAPPCADSLPMTAARQDLAGSGINLLTAGNIMPGLPPSAGGQVTAEPARTDTPRPIAPPRGTLLASLRAVRSAGQDETGQDETGQGSAVPGDETHGAPGAVRDGDGGLVTPAGALAVAPAWSAIRAPSEEPGPAAPFHPAPTPIPTSALPPAIAAQMLGQPLPRQVASGPADPAAASTPRERKLSLAPAAAAPVSFTLASPAPPVAPTAVRLRPVLEPASDAATTPTDPAAAPVTALAADPQASAALSALAGSAAVPAGPGAGDNFAAVIDRLVAARDAARAEMPAQPVAVNLHHADFGEVTVRFEHRGDGLSVALSSPDPGFARAVQAATPPDTGADAGRSGFGGSQSGTAFANSPGTGSQPQRHGQRAQSGPHASMTQAGSTGPLAQGETTQPRPRGIFA